MLRKNLFVGLFASVFVEKHFKNKKKKMTSTKIVCVRHAESEANVILHSNPNLRGVLNDETTALLKSAGHDTNLSSRGVLQAKRVADHLEGALQNIDREKEDLVVLCSPLQRSKQTMGQFHEKEEQTLFKERENIVYLQDLIEYSHENHESPSVFIEQVFRLFLFLHEKANNAQKNQTIFIVGHSLVFNVLFTIISLHQRNLSIQDHRQRVFDRLINADTPRYLECVFHLPNCSTSVARAKKGKMEDTLEWAILGVGKCDYLKENDLLTGHHSDF